jgi:molybdopterin converting factor small subunit
MHITVNIYAQLRRYLPAADKSIYEKDWDMPRDATVGQVLEKLQLPKEVRVTVLVNNNGVDHMAILKEGDVIHILPQLSGG